MSKTKKNPWWLLPVGAVVGVGLGFLIAFVAGTIYKNLQEGGGAYSVAENNGYTGRAGAKVEMSAPDTKLVQYAKNSAVTVVGSVAGEDYGIGSGTIVKDYNGFYYVLTNHHVIDEMDEISVYFYDLDGARAICKIVGTSAEEDIALIKVEKAILRQAIGEERFLQLTVAKFGDSDTIEVGDGIFLLGNPYSAVFEHTVSVGIVGGLDKELTLDGYSRPYFEVDAAMYFGNSGGGAYNYKGELIGVSGAKITVDGVVNMNLVLYGNTAKALIKEFIDNEN